MSKELFVRSYLLLTPFVTGAVIMVLEMLGFRLLAPYFGYSVYVWGSLIGTIMLALACGYWLGGWLADRNGATSLLYGFILLAALYCVGIRLFSFSILHSLIEFDIITGTLLGSLILFGLPMFFLSMVSPFIIAVRAKIGHVGTTAGFIYALSTAGSIVGTFLAAFYLIPTFGTKASLTFCFVTLMVLAIGGLVVRYRSAALALGFLIPLSWIPVSDSYLHLLTKSGHTLSDEESKYARVLVYEDTEENSVNLSSQFLTIHSTLYRDHLLTGNFWDYFNLLPILQPQASHSLFLGVAAGISMTQFKHFAPQLEVDGVEIDDKVIEAGKKYFGLTEDKKSKITIADARPFVERSQKIYDAIALDLYTGDLFIPFYVATQEFYTALKNHLNDSGFVMMNLVDPSPGKKVSKTLVKTVASVFPSLFEIPINPTNTFLIAYKNKTSLDEVKGKLWESQNLELEEVITHSLQEIAEAQIDESAPILSDDHAPLERLSYNAWRDFRALIFSQPDLHL